MSSSSPSPGDARPLEWRKDHGRVLAQVLQASHTPPGSAAGSAHSTPTTATATVVPLMPLRPTYDGPPLVFKYSDAPMAKLTEAGHVQIVLDAAYLEKQTKEVRASYGVRYERLAGAADNDAETGDGFVPRRSNRLREVPAARLPSSSGQKKGVSNILADHYGVTKRTVNRVLSDADHRPSLAPLLRSGRPPHFTPTKQRVVVDAFNEAGGHASFRRVERLVGDIPGYETRYADYRHRHRPSLQTITNYFNSDELAITTLRPRPDLMQSGGRAINERMEYCTTYLDHASESFDLDESYVQQCDKGKRLALMPGDAVPEGAEGVSINSAHGHPPKVFLFAVVTAPDFRIATSDDREQSVEFHPVRNGKVALFRVRGSKSRSRRRRHSETNDLIPKEDDPLYTNIAIDGSVYRHIMEMTGGGLDAIELYKSSQEPLHTGKVLVIPMDANDRGALSMATSSSASASSSSAPRASRQSKRVRPGMDRIQEDGATGHGYDNRHNRTTAVHEALAESCLLRSHKLVKQPRLSPETNLLDLGVWNALKAGVGARAREVPEYNGSNTDAVEAAIWTVVKDEWEKLDARILFNVAMTKEAVFHNIVDVNGAEAGRVVHAGVRKKLGTGSPRRPRDSPGGSAASP